MLVLFPGEHPWLLSEPDSGVEVSVVNTSGQVDRTFLQSLVSGMFTMFTVDTCGQILMNLPPTQTKTEARQVTPSGSSVKEQLGADGRRCLHGIKKRSICSSPVSIVSTQFSTETEEMSKPASQSFYLD